VSLTAAITAEQLTVVHGRRSPVRALDGLDLEVAEGIVLGLLGPNGAGKTTTVRVLATLLRPSSGRATVLGHDVVRQPDRVRAAIGLSGQYAAVDENLTGAENLWMFGRLHRLSSAVARSRAAELLDRFALTAAGGRVVKTYSGGMRRRLDLAAALIPRPRLLFLDEPTTGLDPRSRIGLWEVIRELVRDGTTLLLTTQYLEEADALADRITVVDAGRVIAAGTADQLKARVGGERVEVVVRRPADLGPARSAIGRVGLAVTVDEPARRLVAPAAGTDSLVAVLRALEGIPLDDVGLRRPTLDDVFLSLTGSAA
jgi:ABC-2 type transport system ATP-binding protein